MEQPLKKRRQYSAAFVVLHYEDIEVTRECISYLKVIRDIDKAIIIIVDNASPNGTGKQLFEEYKNATNIVVKLLNDNIGFAGGNNAGYQQAREIYKAKRIIVINNDLFIKDENFLRKLDEIDKSSPDDCIIAPDILSRHGIHQNPYRYGAISTAKQRMIICRKRIGQIIYSIPLIGKRIIHQKPLSSTYRRNEKEICEKYNIVPHGACVIFMPKWVSRESFAFLEGTFLFCEEEILYDYCQYKKYLIHYIPSLEVLHMEDASQNAVAASLLDKKKRQLKYEIQSRKVLLKYRKRYRK